MSQIRFYVEVKGKDVIVSNTIKSKRDSLRITPDMDAVDFQVDRRNRVRVRFKRFEIDKILRIDFLRRSDNARVTSRAIDLRKNGKTTIIFDPWNNIGPK